MYIFTILMLSRWLSATLSHLSLTPLCANTVKHIISLLYAIFIKCKWDSLPLKPVTTCYCMIPHASRSYVHNELPSLFAFQHSRTTTENWTTTTENMSSLRKTTAALIKRTNYSATSTLLPRAGGGAADAAAAPHDGVGVATEIEKSLASGAMQRQRQQQQQQRIESAISRWVLTASNTCCILWHTICNSNTTAATVTTTAAAATATTTTSATATATPAVRPYEEVPGPYPLPLIGNSWRFAPLIG